MVQCKFQRWGELGSSHLVWAQTHNTRMQHMCDMPTHRHTTTCTYPSNQACQGKASVEDGAGFGGGLNCLGSAKGQERPPEGGRAGLVSWGLLAQGSLSRPHCAGPGPGSGRRAASGLCRMKKSAPEGRLWSSRSGLCGRQAVGRGRTPEAKAGAGSSHSRDQGGQCGCWGCPAGWPPASQACVEGTGRRNSLRRLTRARTPH